MHRWQDLVLAVGLIVFNLALIPSLFSKNKPAFITSALTAAVVLTVLAVYVSLSLWFATIMCATNFLLWATLAAQAYKVRHTD
jgi:hypothetical protein